MQTSHSHCESQYVILALIQKLNDYYVHLLIMMYDNDHDIMYSNVQPIYRSFCNNGNTWKGMWGFPLM